MPGVRKAPRSRSGTDESAALSVALIAGDGPLARLAGILARDGFSPSFCDSLEALFEIDRPTTPAVILVWVQDPASSMSASLEPLTSGSGETPIVVACPEIQRWEVRAALAAGAAGVIVCAELDTALGACVRAVHAGQICVPRAHWRQVAPPILSTREKQILSLVVMGYMNCQIAEQLYVAESTVKSHLSSAFGKLGVRSRNEAVSLILDPQHGLGMGILGLGGEPLQLEQSGAH